MSVFSSPPVTSEVLDATRVWIFVLSVSEQSSKLLFDFGIRRVAYVTSYLTAPLSLSLPHSFNHSSSFALFQLPLSLFLSLYLTRHALTYSQTNSTKIGLSTSIDILLPLNNWTLAEIKSWARHTFFFNIEPSWLFTMSSSSFLGYFFKFNSVHVVSLLRPKQHS